MDTVHIFLQHYWWFIISLLGALLVFLLFVQGGQAMLYTIGRTETERNLIVNSLGRKWELTFTTLVTFGGAFFASFPLFYSTSFGGAFYVWMLILLVFVIQAVSYEYRRKPSNFLGEKTFNAFLIVNGIAGTFLLGTAVGTLFFGAQFTVDRANFASTDGFNTISQWATPWYGLDALADPRNILLGLAVLFLSRVLGLLYFMNNIDEQSIFDRRGVTCAGTRRHSSRRSWPFWSRCCSPGAGRSIRQAAGSARSRTSICTTCLRCRSFSCCWSQVSSPCCGASPRGCSAGAAGVSGSPARARC